MKTFITATLGGLAALSIAAAIGSILPSTFAEKVPVQRSPDNELPSENLKARGSGRNEEETLISNNSETDPPPKKSTKTEIASKAGEAQATHKDATPPPNSGDPRRD